MQETGISKILRTKNTVFTFKDISLLWEETDMNLAKRRINHYVTTGKLLSIRRGIYVKDKNYDKLELATRIFTPSYVSFETVLGQAGITFQYYSQIFVVSYLTRDIKCDGQVYSFRKIKDIVLINKKGLENKGEYLMASKERAFLDTIYINKDYHFDNLSPLDWDKIFEVLPIYENKRMTRRVKEFFEHFKSNEK